MPRRPVSMVVQRFAYNDSPSLRQAHSLLVNRIFANGDEGRYVAYVEADGEGFALCLMDMHPERSGWDMA